MVDTPFPAAVEAKQQEARRTGDVFQPDHQMGVTVSLVEQEACNHRENSHEHRGDTGQASESDGDTAADFQQDLQGSQEGRHVVRRHQLHVASTSRNLVDT